MVDIVDRIVQFEDMLKRGEQLTRPQEHQKKMLEPVATELKRVHKRDGTVVKRGPTLRSSSDV